MLYTSYFGFVPKLPNNIHLVSIALYPPDWYQGYECRQLVPTKELFRHWKQNHDIAYYTEYYKDNILNNVNRFDILDELQKIFIKETGRTEPFYKSKEEHIALLCFEKSREFCHRHLVARWFVQIGIPCQEYTSVRQSLLI